ncbi:MAG: hypothetical protein ACRDTD_24080 [Pseudonocardiaceae bacterium]
MRELTYEITAHSLPRAAAEQTPAAAVAARQYQTMDTEAVQFLHACAEITCVRWRTSVADVARFALAVLDGLVLRWLVERGSVTCEVGTRASEMFAKSRTPRPEPIPIATTPCRG